MRHRVNSRDVAQEEIDGEVIIVHLTNGYYYSLDGSAADIWSGVVRGASDREIADTVAARFEGDPDRIRDGVRGFLNELREEELIVPHDSADGPGDESIDEPADVATVGATRSAGETRGAFEAPVLHRYSDMQELLLVDPIHEVEDAGWPEKTARSDP